MKKIPLRRCVVTKEQLPKSELLRIVKDKEGNISVDLTGKLNGRGAYIKKDIEVLNTARNKNILSRALEVSIPEEVYNEIENIIKNN
ncbi:MAG: RNase P modulator RnpM [Bacilli bacterium]